MSVPGSAPNNAINPDLRDAARPSAGYGERSAAQVTMKRVMVVNVASGDHLEGKTQWSRFS
jgi:hypothetical protein